MRFTVFIVIILFSLNVSAQGRICEVESIEKNVSKWIEKDGALCTSATCKDEELEYPREKCILQSKDDHPNIIYVTYSDEIRTKDSLRVLSRYDRIMLNMEDICYESCRPIKESKKIKSGLDRKSCISCFKNRNDVRYDTSFFYPEIGKKLHRAQKCGIICRDQEGPIQSERTITLECKQCVGIEGYQGEVFDYIQNMDGQCFEFDSTAKFRRVPEVLCSQSKDVILTEYIQRGNIFQVLFEQDKECYEVDDLTKGKFYNIKVQREHCFPAPVNLSDRDDSPDSRVKSKKALESSSTSQQ